MITPRFNPLFDAFVHAILRWQFRRRFHGIYALGLDYLEDLPKDRAVIVSPNHTNWWDGFVARLAFEKLRSRKPVGRLMQEEKQLAEAKFFRMLGVYGIDLDNPLPAMRYSLRLLRDPRVQLWMFPQGDLVPQWAPITLRPGLERLAQKSGAAVLPLAIRYEWLIESRPSIFLHFGPVMASQDVDTAGLQQVMRQLYDDLAPRIRGIDLEPFVPLQKPGMSVNKRFEQFMRLIRRSPTNFQRHNR